MGDGMKDKEMASMLKGKGDARHSTRCPVCHAVISGHRNGARDGSPKGFSDYDFKSALQSHFQTHTGSR